MDTDKKTQVYTDKRFGEERALYGLKDVKLVRCSIAGEEDGESALKECGAVVAEDSFFDLRYPFWHDRSVEITGCELTPNCRAALWYSKNIRISGSSLHGIKALRECKNAEIRGCDIISPEFGWSTDGIIFENTHAESEYFCLRAKNIRASGLDFTGKYSFQYVENAEFDNCTFNTKDAFWHGKNIVVKNSKVKGEYLAWFAKDITFVNCEIIGTQPLCYCKGLKLVDCRMTDADLAFERSEVTATLTAPIISIKNPYAGSITVPEVGEIILDDKKAKGKIIIN